MLSSYSNFSDRKEYSNNFEDLNRKNLANSFSSSSIKPYNEVAFVGADLRKMDPNSNLREASHVFNSFRESENIANKLVTINSNNQSQSEEICGMDLRSTNSRRSSFRDSLSGFSNHSDNEMAHSSPRSCISSVSDDCFDPPKNSINFQVEAKKNCNNLSSDNLRSSKKLKEYDIGVLDLSKESHFAENNNAYQLLSDAIKQELFRALEHLVDKSAKSVLAGLKEKTKGHHDLSSIVDSGSFNNLTVFKPLKAKESIQENFSEPIASKSLQKLPHVLPHKVSLTSNVIIHGDTDHLRTASQSQLCFGEVIVENDVEERKTLRLHQETNQCSVETQSRKEKTNALAEKQQEFMIENSSEIANASAKNIACEYKATDQQFKESVKQPNSFELPGSSYSIPSSLYPSYVDHHANASNKSTLNMSNSPYGLPTKIPSIYPLAPFPLSASNFYAPSFNAYQAALLSNLIKPQTFQSNSSSNTPYNPFSIYAKTWEPTTEPCGNSLGKNSTATISLSNPEISNKLSEHSSFQKFLGKIKSNGLTPQHLRKAKLMFFYARYPNTNTIKSYFSDVQFTRATTSQLIKWFSNFREFFYIQVEKFARQALNEGITDAEQLHVGRESEILRVLKHHFNKNSDYHVPQEFLAVTLRSLQEFYGAIKLGKDFDPAWKKSIYKIICKLDQDIPEYFKTTKMPKHFRKSEH